MIKIDESKIRNSMITHGFLCPPDTFKYDEWVKFPYDDSSSKDSCSYKIFSNSGICQYQQMPNGVLFSVFPPSDNDDKDFTNSQLSEKEDFSNINAESKKISSALFNRTTKRTRPLATASFTIYNEIDYNQEVLSSSLEEFQDSKVFLEGECISGQESLLEDVNTVLSAFNRENGLSVERKGGIRYSNENNEDLDYNEKGEKNGIYRQEQGDNQGASDRRGYGQNIDRNLWKSNRVRKVLHEDIQEGLRQYEGNDGRRYTGRISSTISQEIKEKIQQKWRTEFDDVSFVKLEKDDESINTFADKLTEARSGKFGYMVDSKTIEQLKDKNTKVFLSEDGNAGFAIEYDYEGHRGVNNIVAVFNYGFNGSQKAKRGVYSILINAIEQGGNVLDCYAGGLQTMYSRLGFVPYQKMDFNIDYVDNEEKAYWERDFQDGEYPPVCAMYFPFSSIDDFVNNLDTVSEVSSDLSNIPTATDYEEMMNGRDALVQENIAIENIKNATNAVIDL